MTETKEEAENEIKKINDALEYLYKYYVWIKYVFFFFGIYMRKIKIIILTAILIIVLIFFFLLNPLNLEMLMS